MYKSPDLCCSLKILGITELGIVWEKYLILGPKVRVSEMSTYSFVEAHLVLELLRGFSLCFIVEIIS